MVQPYLGPLKRFDTIDMRELANIRDALERPLSEMIGGDPATGLWVHELEVQWTGTFGAESIACNSATSGLLAACMAVGVTHRDWVWTTPYSMSATAACAKVLGAKLRFIDIEDIRFGINPLILQTLAARFDRDIKKPKALIVTNLFGHPAHLKLIRDWCVQHSIWMIEDNAQSPFATEDGAYTGTVGHIGVFSLNVHKHIQCGEGGVIVTDNISLAGRLRSIINHGELSTEYPIKAGLNLRMTEPTAAIACAQLAKAGSIMRGRRDFALELTDMMSGVDWLLPHGDDAGCKHVYYLWTALLDHKGLAASLVRRLQERGVPIRCSYAPLLHKLFRSKDKCPMVEDVDNRIIVFEVCAYDLSSAQMKMLREIVKRAMGELDEPARQRLSA